MNVLLLLVTGMAVVKGDITPLPATRCNCFDPQDNQSLLHYLLNVTGYTDTCVAAALDSCSPLEDGHFASLMKEARRIVQQVSLLVDHSESRPRHCKDLLDSGDSGKGLRKVYPYHWRPHEHVTVYCDHTADGGGWTVFQRRTNDTTVREDFYRTLVEYQLGFGDLESEFWLGLDLLHELTSTTLQELRIDLADYEGAHRWAKYGFFHVDAPETKYRLSVGRYSGDAEDSMAVHNNKPFSISSPYRGGWWYTPGHHANLNGKPHVGHHTSNADGINWYHWRGHKYSLRQTSMMIRPAF